MKTLFILLSIVSLQAFGLGSDAFADNPNPGTVVNVDASTQSSQNYTGQAYSVDMDHKFADGDHILFGTHLFTRSFNNGPTLTDEGISAGYVSVLAKNVYWENGLLLNPNANFTPLWAFATTPHYVFGNNDLSMGVSASRYKVLSAGTLSPRILHEFRYFSLGAGVYATRTYDDVIAYYGVAIIKPVNKQSLRIDYSFGRAIEDQGVETNYTAVTAIYGYEISGRWKIGPYGSFFRSTLRNEDSFGIRLDLGL